MKPTLRLVWLLLLLIPTINLAQNSVGIGTENSNNNAVLELVSPNDNQGFLVPRLTTTQRTASGFTNNLAPTDNGLLVFDSDEKKFYYWHDNQWQPIKNGPDLIAGTGIDITSGVITNTGDTDASDDFSGDFNDLVNVPVSLDLDATDDFSGDFGDLINVPINLDTDATDDFDGNFSSLLGVPAGLSDGDNVNDADADPLNEIQDLNLSGNTLTITNNASATAIDLAPFAGNTDNQTLSFIGNSLSITGGNSVTLTDVDPVNELQTISLGTNNFTLSNGGGTVPLFSGSYTDLSNIPADLADGDDDTIYAAGTGISISGGVISSTGDTDGSDDFDGAWSSLTGIPADIADGDDNTTYTAGAGINISGTTVINTGDTNASDDFSGSFPDLTNVPVNLDTDFTDDFDGAWTSLSGIPAEIADGDDVDDADNSITNELQNISLSGDEVSLTGSTSTIDLAPYRDNTDDQTLSLSTNTLSLTSASSAGSNVDLSGYLDNTDSQDLSLIVSATNRTIDISGGGTGVIFSVADNDNNSTNEIQSISKTGNTLSLSNGGGSVSILQPSAFRTGLTKDQALNSTASLIAFEIEDYDLNDDFDGSSTFVAPVNGIFNFSGLISTLVDTGIDGQLFFMVEGSVAHAIYLTSSTNNSSHPFSVDLSLTASDRVQLFISSNNSGNMLGSLAQTNWSGRLVMETSK